MSARSAGAVLALLALAACAPGGGAPEGVDRAVLDEMVSRAIGDPNTCVIIARRGSGENVYRYGTYVACERGLPACSDGGTRSTAELAKAVAASGQSMNASCPSSADRSRGVAWAAGPIEGRDLIYAASMEGPATPPGLVIADKLDGAFRQAGVLPKGG